MKPSLKIVRELTGRYFYIIETYITTDGWRTRICDGRWADEDEAIHAWNEKVKEIQS